MVTPHTPVHTCRKCGEPYASNDQCIACQTALGSLLVAEANRKAAVMRDMENAARYAPANRRFTVVPMRGQR